MFHRQDSIDFDEGSGSSYGETLVEVVETITVPVETITIDDINAATIVLSSDSSDSHSECAAPSKSNAMKKRRVENLNKRKRENSSSSSDEDILMEKALAIMNEKHDELDVFGQFVASEMRQISDLSARNFVKRKIMAILMNSDGMHEMQNHFQHISTGSSDYLTSEQFIFDPPCSI